MKELTVSLDSFSTRLRLLEIAHVADVPADTTADKVLWVSDRDVWNALTGPKAPARFHAAFAPLIAGRNPDGSAIPAGHVYLIASGEEHKTWEQVAGILTKGFERGLARDGYIIGLGGGVVTDMAAFAASLYMRGCRCILVPSTLLAQVDASFGGKTGINFGGWKNMVGSFYPAAEVRVVPELNVTLPEAEYLSGLGEVIKHGFLADRELYAILVEKRAEVLARNPAVLTDIVWRSLLVKAKVVEADLYEKSIRAHLNLGHTFAHGLESAAGFGVWSHGEAVAWGMVRAAMLSHRLGHCDKAWVTEVRGMIESYGYRTHAEGVGIDNLIQAMLMDKKKKDGKVRFILQHGMCDTFMQPVDEADLRAVLEAD